MKKNVFVAAAFSLGLGGCANLMMDWKTPDPGNPKVSVVSGRLLVVNQEPIVVPKGAKNFRITWELPRGSNYNFPADGIAVEKGRDEFSCNLEKDTQRFSCVFRNSKPGRYKYTIKANDGDKALPPLDPIIMSDG